MSLGEAIGTAAGTAIGTQLSSVRDSKSSTGGFWSTTGGAILGGFLGPLADSALSREVTANENQFNREFNEYMANKEFYHNKELMQLQQEFEKNMSNTAYQRAVADMEKAGINPATMAGTNAVQASTPGSSVPGNHAYGSSAIGYNSSSPLNSMISSAFNAILSKSKSAADIAKSELVDNAKHAHYVEEATERQNLYNAKLEAYQAQRNYYNNKFYDDLEKMEAWKLKND